VLLSTLQTLPPPPLRSLALAPPLQYPFQISSQKRDTDDAMSGQWCHLPNASANAVCWRAKQGVGTWQVSVRSVVNEPARVGNTSQLGGRRQPLKAPVETVDVE